MRFSNEWYQKVDEETRRISGDKLNSGSLDHTTMVSRQIPIQKIREASINMSAKPKVILLQIRAAISFNRNTELTNHYHARKYNWALAKHINDDLGYDAIRVYGSTVYFTSKFRKEIGG